MIYRPGLKYRVAVDVAADTRLRSSYLPHSETSSVAIFPVCDTSAPYASTPVPTIETLKRLQINSNKRSSGLDYLLATCQIGPR